MKGRHVGLSCMVTSAVVFDSRRDGPTSCRLVLARVSRYEEACCLFNLTLLADRRDSLCSKLFRQLVSEYRIFHYLLPAKRDD